MRWLHLQYNAAAAATFTSILSPTKVLHTASKKIDLYIHIPHLLSKEIDTNYQQRRSLAPRVNA